MLFIDQMNISNPRLASALEFVISECSKRDIVDRQITLVNNTHAEQRWSGVISDVYCREAFSGGVVEWHSSSINIKSSVTTAKLVLRYELIMQMQLVEGVVSVRVPADLDKRLLRDESNPNAFVVRLGPTAIRNFKRQLATQGVSDQCPL